jgi:hypothetical protein
MKVKSVLHLIIALMAYISLTSCAASGGNVYPLSSKYLRTDNLSAELSRIANLNPALAQLRIIGFSGSEKLPIYALEIGGKAAKRNLLLIGQHHGDEVLGVNISSAFAEELIKGYAINEEYESLLNTCRFWIIPSLNPEGFRLVSSGEFRFKRKNNTDTDGNKLLDLRTDGVDLNRNYPVFWDLDTDINVTSPFYKGKEPVSESEIKAVIALAQEKNFEVAIFLHSSASGAFNEKIYLPARGNNSPLYMQTKALASSYAASLKKDYLKGTYEVREGYASEVGNARNFFYHRMGARAFLVEIGGINKDGKSIIHPDNKMLDKIVKKHVRSLGKLFIGYAAKDAKK